MKYLIAVFKSRTDSQLFLEELKRRGIICSLIATPKEAHVGCGISVKLPLNYLQFAKSLVYSGRYQSFYTFILIEKIGNRVSTVRI